MTTESTIVRLELRRAGEHGLEGICVPYNVTTLKAGHVRGERFLPGAFAELDQRSKIRLTDSHLEAEQRRPVGVGTEFRDTPQGLFGAFRFYDTPEGRGARENVLEETYGGLSVGFVPVAERVGDDGAREIVKARLFHVSLVDEPAYDDARVLAVRSSKMPDELSELLAVSYDPDSFAEPVDLAALVFGDYRP
jgi:HK97 family phage prohead protease